MTRNILMILGVIAALGVGAWYVSVRPLDMSGAYVAQDDHQAFLLQVVQAAGGTLTGTLQAAEISSNGSFQSASVAVSGARDGQTIVLTLTPTGLQHLFVGPVSLSGTLVGSALTVEGGGPDINLNLHLQAGNLARYEEAVAALQKQSAALIAGQAAAARQQQMLAAQAAAQAAEKARQQAARAAAQNLNHQAAIEFDMANRGHAGVDARIAELSAYAEKLIADTNRMAELVKSESAAGGYLGRYGNQVATSVQQAEFRNDQGVRDLRQHLDAVRQSGLIALLQQVQKTEAACGPLISKAGTAGSPSQDDAGCRNLATVTPSLESDVNRLVAAYDRVFSTWAAEKPRQDALVSQAFR